MPAHATLALVAALAAAPADASDPDFSAEQLARWEARFRAADTNGDRALDRAEVEAAMPAGLQRDFERTDADADGRLSPEEMLQRQRELKAEREARRRRFSGRP